MTTRHWDYRVAAFMGVAVFLGCWMAAPALAQAAPAPGAQGPGTNPVRRSITVALIAGEGAEAPPAALMAELPVAFGQAAPGGLSVRLVERERLLAVLGEQKLSLAGAVDPDRVVAVGHLVAADLFVFIDQLSAGDAGAVGSGGSGGSGGAVPLCRQRVVEAVTGVILDDRVAPVPPGNDQAGPWLAGLAAAVKLWRTPSGARRYVGLLGFHNEEANTLLDRQAAALAAFFPLDVRAIPGVIPLERQRLDHLRQEEHLAAVDLALRNSTLLVEGGLHREAAGKVWRISLNLTRPGDARAQALIIDTPAGDLAAARRGITDALARQWSQAPPDVSRARPVDPQAEAAMFQARARRLIDYQHPREAFEAAQAAQALAPSDKGARLVLEAAVACTPTGFAQNQDVIDIAGLRIYCCRRELENQMMADRLSGPNQLGDARRTRDIVPSAWFPHFVPHDAAERELYHQAFELLVDWDRLYLAYNPQGPGSDARGKRFAYGTDLLLAAWQALDDPGEFADFARPVIEDIEVWLDTHRDEAGGTADAQTQPQTAPASPFGGPSAGVPPTIPPRLNFPPWMVDAMAIRARRSAFSEIGERCDTIAKVCFVPPPTARNTRRWLDGVRPLQDWLVTRPHPLLRTLALMRRGQIGIEPHESAVKALRVLVLEVPTRPELKQFFDPEQMPTRAEFVFDMVDVLEGNATTLEHDLKDLVEPVNQTGNPECCRALLAAAMHFPTMAHRSRAAVAPGLMPNAVSGNYSGVARAILACPFRPEFASAVAEARTENQYRNLNPLTRLRTPAPGRFPRVHPVPPVPETQSGDSVPWDRFEIHRLTLGTYAPPDLHVSVATEVPGGLLLLWTGQGGGSWSARHIVTVAVTLVDLRGTHSLVGMMAARWAPGTGPMAALDHGVSGENADFWRMIVDGNVVYAAPLGSRAGLLIFNGRNSHNITSEEGLPSDCITAMAWMDGALYLALTSQDSLTGSLARYDPKSQRFEILASCRSVVVHTPLDAGNPYLVKSMLAVPDTHALWFECESKDPDRAGVWRFTATDRKFQRVKALAPSTFMAPIIIVTPHPLSESLRQVGRFVVIPKGGYVNVDTLSVDGAAPPEVTTTLAGMRHDDGSSMVAGDATLQLVGQIELNYQDADGTAHRAVLAAFPVDAGTDAQEPPRHGHSAHQTPSMTVVGPYPPGLVITERGTQRVYLVTLKGQAPTDLPLGPALPLTTAAIYERHR